jgi:CRP-like cAMP-binding protein
MDAAEALGPTWMSRLVEVLQPLSVRVDRLAATELFGGLERTDLQLAANLLSDAVVERGTRMTVQGTPSTRLWVILEGQALVSADARPIRVASHGHVVGLTSMLLASTSPETTIALTPIRAFEADPTQFRELMNHAPLRSRLAAVAGMPARPRRRRIRS